MCNVMTENQIQPHSPHPNAIPTRLLLKGQTTQKPKLKRLVLESMDQIIKNTITINTKRQKKKSNKYKFLCCQKEITCTYLIFLFYHQYLVKL